MATGSAALIGLVAGIIVYLGGYWLEQKRIDDAIGVVPVHLFAGIWGTVALALFGNIELFTVDVTRWQQFQSQAIGIFSIGIYSFSWTNDSIPIAWFFI